MPEIPQMLIYARNQSNRRTIDDKTRAILIALASLQGLGKTVQSVGDWMFKSEEAERRAQRFAKEQKEDERTRIATELAFTPGTRSVSPEVELKRRAILNQMAEWDRAAERFKIFSAADARAAAEHELSKQRAERAEIEHGWREEERKKAQKTQVAAGTLPPEASLDTVPPELRPSVNALRASMAQSQAGLRGEAEALSAIAGWRKPEVAARRIGELLSINRLKGEAEGRTQKQQADLSTAYMKQALNTVSDNLILLRPEWLNSTESIIKVANSLTADGAKFAIGEGMELPGEVTFEELDRLRKNGASPYVLLTKAALFNKQGKPKTATIDSLLPAKLALAKERGARGTFESLSRLGTAPKGVQEIEGRFFLSPQWTTPYTRKSLDEYLSKFKKRPDITWRPGLAAVKDVRGSFIQLPEISQSRRGAMILGQQDEALPPPAKPSGPAPRARAMKGRMLYTPEQVEVWNRIAQEVLEEYGKQFKEFDIGE